MEKSCANHPESMALATCKACEKSICLMCVVDEKEGTFCSSDCHTAFANGQEVPKFVAAAVESAAPAAGGQKKIDSIFDDEPSAPPAHSEEHQAPPSDDPMPIVAEGTKWRPIGQQCQNHSDTPAVANCDRCSKPVCALCLLEASQGTFCSADCMGAVAKQPAAQPAPAERAALQGRPVVNYKISSKASRRGSNTGIIVAATVILLGAVGAGVYYGWNSFSFQPTDPKDPVVENPVTPTNPVTPEVVRNPDPVTPEVVTPPVKNPDPSPEVGVKDPAPVYYMPRKRPVKVVANLTRTLNPWSEQELGTWYRIRNERGGKVSYTDIGLKEKGKDFYVLSTQTATDGQPAPASEARTTPPTVFLRGEESFTFENREFPCEIRSPGLEETAAKTWALLSGRYQGTIIKSVTPEGSFTAARVWEHSIKVNGEPLDCLVVEGQQKNGATSGYVKRWYCGMNPLGVVRMESDGESFVLVDQGSDWSKRPAFPK
jgi:hypothetical protein